MAEVILYNQAGEKIGNVSLDASLFEVAGNAALVHEAVVAQQINSREVIAHTKDRGEVRGGGKKPWKQKGTGRARHGSRRSPIWVGGGVTFGPRNERVFSAKMNRKARRKALAMVLSDKVSSERFVAVDKLEIADGKTSVLAKTIASLPVAGKKTLLVLEDENVAAARAARNLQGVTTISPKSLNIVDLLRHEYVLLPKAAISVIENTYKR